MKPVAFSSWNGKIIDGRKGQPKGKAGAADIGCPVPKEGQKMSALLGWNGLVVLDKDADIPSLTLAYLKEARKLSCGECSVCMIGIDRVTALLKDMAAGKADKGALGEIEEIAKGVAKNGKCNFGRATALTPVLDAIKHYKNDFLALAKGGKLEEKACSVAVTAPCMQACPATLDIPGYIELIRNGRFADSLNLIRERCILPGVIGRACTHPCESACVRNDIDEPLAIRLLKRSAADADLQSGGCGLAAPKEEKKQKVAVVGSGPAGLAAAYRLRVLGYPVTVFEALPKAGGMAAVGIPDYRLPKDILNHEIDLIRRTGVDVRLNSPVSPLDWAGLQKKGYGALYLAVGAHVGTKVGCGGEDVKDGGFIQGAEFLRNLSLGAKVTPLKKVVIIGGGNVALDCARSCVRFGFKDVEILYRRSRKEMPASATEIEEAVEEGVKFTYLVAPANIVRQGGKVTGVECLKMKLGEPDASGRRRPIPVKGSEFVVKTDLIIAATGQKPDTVFLSGKSKVGLTDWGTIKVDEATLQTNVPGVFSGGDCVSGPATLIEALDAGNKAARSIDAYLAGKAVAPELSLKGLDTKAQRDSGFTAKAGAAKAALLNPKERTAVFAEVEAGLSAAAAMKEAGRCLRCYRLLVWE
ncbi:MAG: dihydropyrimidine dehydrogenase subunit A [Deltaproteobacteria bacterium HGW-Deltaproteobacteria-19]|jgi:formate dehydrogenase beta subunit|nr:MAG: dihydropyrimidine dehydrogenase subunit A [Deltaproteobacteria bacterium HGW-Deltaproteobacteria-19]